MCKGTIFNIQRFSIHDGPGIRTTVFVKGCPLRCQWCHNPEGLSTRKQILYHAENCTACRACIPVCDQQCHSFSKGLHFFDRTQCMHCQKCADACVYDALQACGKSITVQEVMETVIRDRAFYKTSGGGMTISGGEPLMQPKFTSELLACARKEGIHCTVESCGFASAQVAREVFSQADLVLLDWKHSNADHLFLVTGAQQSVIIRTLEILLELQKPVILRCPIIPDVNDTQEHFEGIAAIVARFANIEQVHVMPYHSFGSEKQSRLNENSTAHVFRVPEKEEIDAWLASLHEKITTIPVKHG